MQKLIPWAKPYFFGQEKKYLLNAIKSTWISDGQYILKLEKIIKKKLKTNYAFAVNNGTSAIHLAFLAAGLKPGDEIIVPGYGYMAAANIAKLMNLKVRFADIDKRTFCLDLVNLKKSLTKKTKAVVTINTYGNVKDLDKIKKFLSSKKILFIEDAAESLCSKYKNKYAGTFGDMGTFSFHATKSIVTGEGGMVITNNSKLAKMLSLYRSHGVKKLRYKHYVHGHNFRLTNLQAAIGFAQFKNINKIVKKRQQIYKWYLKFINDEKICLQKFEDIKQAVPWTFAFYLNNSKYSRDEIIKKMREKKIETRNGFYSADRLKIFSANKNKLLNSNILSKKTICLPFFYEMSVKDVCKICKNINKFTN